MGKNNKILFTITNNLRIGVRLSENAAARHMGGGILRGWLASRNPDLDYSASRHARPQNRPILCAGAGDQHWGPEGQQPV